MQFFVVVKVEVEFPPLWALEHDNTDDYKIFAFVFRKTIILRLWLYLFLIVVHFETHELLFHLSTASFGIITFFWTETSIDMIFIFLLSASETE